MRSRRPRLSTITLLYTPLASITSAVSVDERSSMHAVSGSIFACTPVKRHSSVKSVRRVSGRGRVCRSTSPSTRWRNDTAAWRAGDVSDYVEPSPGIWSSTVVLNGMRVRNVECGLHSVTCGRGTCEHTLSRSHTGCLQLLEILEISWNFVDAPGESS